MRSSDPYNVGDTVCSDIVVLNDTESGIRGLALHQLGCGVDIVSPLVER